MTTTVTLATQAFAQTAVAKRTDAMLREFLTERQGEFAMIAKASGVEAAVLVAELVSAARKKPEILECTPDSIINFMYDAAKTGLIIGKGCFAVAVRDNKAGTKLLNHWIGSKGAKELAVYGRGCRDAYAHVRFEGDPFEERLGSFSEIRHQPGPHFHDMKKALGVYAVAVISQTVHRHIYLTRAQVEKLRAMNRGDTHAPSSPWMTHEEEMWKAKALLRLCNDLPSNPRLAHAFAILERNEGVDLRAADDAPAALEAPAVAGTPAVAATATAVFEEESTITGPEAVVLPNWRAHPLGGKALHECDTAALTVLHKELSDNDKKGHYTRLLDDIAMVLENRRQAA